MHAFLKYNKVTFENDIKATLKGLVHLKKGSVIIYSPSKTGMIYFLIWNTKGEILKNALGPLFHQFQ